MARIRKFVAYRRLDARPNTRFSKYTKKNYVRARPVSKVTKYNMGDPKRIYEVTLHLCSKAHLQVRDNAIESARQTANRYLEKKVGKGMFYFQTRIYPHHVLRENPLAAGAGADRMSTGMARSFGKPIGVAARVKIGQELFSVSVARKHIPEARDALRRATSKLPFSMSVKEVPFVSPILKRIRA